MFIQINDNIVNLDYVRAIHKSKNTNYENVTTYCIVFHIYSRNQTFSINFKSKDERDKAFKFIEEQLVTYNKDKKYPSLSLSVWNRNK